MDLNILAKIVDNRLRLSTDETPVLAPVLPEMKKESASPPGLEVGSECTGHQVRDFPAPSRSIVGAHAIRGICDPERNESSEAHLEDSSPSLFFVDHASLIFDPSDNKEEDEDTAPSEEISSSAELVEAKIVSDRSKHSARVSWRVFSLALATVTAIAIAMLVALSKGHDTHVRGTSKAKNMEEDVPDGRIYPPFQDDLPHYLLNPIQELDSPYYLANQWVLQDPRLNTYSPERQRQRFHMVSLYFALDGDNWIQNDHWLSYEVSECGWFSQLHPDYNLYDSYPVCDENSNLLKLNLAANNLQGTLPVLLQFIPTLRVFNLEHNQIDGAFPVSAQYPDIEVVIMSHNKLGPRLISQGEVSSQKVRVLKLNDNEMLGHYGEIWKLCTSLEYLDLSSNHFSGTITPNFQYTRMKELVLEGNLYEGTVPSELGLLTDLEKLDISKSNLVTGTLPSELGLLTKLTYLDMTETKIYGTLPAVLCRRCKDQMLVIQANCTRVECC